ncbi:MAG: tRNA pseudouridine(55) synthase TruB, partial [cyanobacterium endosymbiont of Rhopalodia yunnanensis]
IPKKTVYIEQINLVGWYTGEFPELEVDIVCGPGTYIRAIARDLGTMLNLGGTLARLTRTESCGMKLSES